MSGEIKPAATVTACMSECKINYGESVKCCNGDYILLLVILVCSYCGLLLFVHVVTPLIIS